MVLRECEEVTPRVECTVTKMLMQRCTCLLLLGSVDSNLGWLLLQCSVAYCAVFETYSGCSFRIFTHSPHITHRLVPYTKNLPLSCTTQYLCSDTQVIAFCQLTAYLLCLLRFSQRCDEDSVLQDETLRHWLNGTRRFERTYCVTSHHSALLPLQAFFLLFLTLKVPPLHNKVDAILQ